MTRDKVLHPSFIRCLRQTAYENFNFIHSFIIPFTIPTTDGYMLAELTADFGYDDYKLYNLSIGRRGFELVCPVSEIYNNTSSDRLLQLIEIL